MKNVISYSGWQYLEAQELNPIQMADFSGRCVCACDKGLRVGSDLIVPFGDFLAKNMETGELKTTSCNDMNTVKLVGKVIPAETGDIREGIFKDIVGKLYETYKKKNADYNGSFEKLFSEWGMPYGIMHLEEKLERIKSLQSKPNQVSGESYVDSLEDMANYAILTLIELRLQEKEPQE